MQLWRPESELDGINSGSWYDYLKVKKVKASHTRYRALGPELIPMYRQSAAGDRKSSTRR